MNKLMNYRHFADDNSSSTVTSFPFTIVNKIDLIPLIIVSYAQLLNYFFNGMKIVNKKRNILFQIRF